MEINVSYKTIYRRVQRLLRALDAPLSHLKGPVEIDELYVKDGLKGREREQPSRSRGLLYAWAWNTRQGQTVLVLAERGTSDQYVIPAKSTDESTIRLLLADRHQESLTVYTDGFRPYEPLDEDDAFTREYVVHGDGEYVDGDVHVNTCESHGSLVRSWLSPHRGVSKDKLTPYLRAFQLCHRVYRKPGEEALKPFLKQYCDSPIIYATRANHKMKVIRYNYSRREY